VSSQLTPAVSEHDHVLGPADAPVTLVEYGDYECPHCGRAFPIVERVRQRMGDRLRFVFRNFPLSEAHPHAEHAAEAAESAGARGGDTAFWAMHDTIFQHQADLSDAALVTYAKVAGVDGNAVAEDIENRRHGDRIRADFMSGVRSGVNGTPSFFINGVRFDGSWDEESLVSTLELVARRSHR
jgi:protein-disulfide isomerase